MRINTVLLMTALFIATTIGTASATCNSAYVQVNGSIITVLPTGSDDTANLKCAFDLGVGMPGAVVQLSKGTYVTDRIVVDGFVGTLRGAGMDATIMRNPDYSVYVTPDDCFSVPPESPDYAPPYLFVFVGGDYTVADLTVTIIGETPATDWSIWGIRQWLGHGIRSLGGPFMIVGSASGLGHRQANAAFVRVKMKGEATSDELMQNNVYNAIFYEGAADDFLPLKGGFSVRDSVFETVASANPVWNVVDSRIEISGNTYTNVGWGAEILDLTDSTVEFSRNRFTGYMGVHTLNNCVGGASNCGFDSTSLIFKNNTIRGSEGLILEGTFANGTNALVLGNNVSHVTDTAVYLGPESNHCTVVGKGDGLLIDEGTDNSITGMTKGSGAQGQRIKSFLQLIKGH